MKRLALLSVIFALNLFCATAQRLYDDFENIHFVEYWERSGILDSAAANPLPNIVNSSSKCGKYIRNHSINYDFLKMLPDSMIDIRPYLGITALSKIRMHILTAAPTNTVIEIQMGKQGTPDTSFTMTTHSIFRANTVTRNQWEELTFNFVQYIDTANIKPWEIDKIVLLISPNDTSYPDSVKYMRDTVYFDNLTGPQFTNVGINKIRESVIELGEIYPNPARNKASLLYTVKTPVTVRVSIYDVLGNEVKAMSMSRVPGEYREDISISELPPGTYYYQLSSGHDFKVRRLTIVR